MKPRTFTILAVVLAVIGVSSYVAGSVMRSRVNDAIQQLGGAPAIGRTLDELDEAQQAQRIAALEEALRTSERAGLLTRIGIGAFALAVIANSMRRRWMLQAAERSMDRRGEPAAEAAPPATSKL